MICLRCDNEHFAPAEAEVKQEFRGEALAVKTPVMICQQCGWHTVGNDQISELRRRTADAYRKKHGLLTSTQIRAMRENFGMSQAQFADFLHVGVASVKRWETWLVQEASSDELIRVKCVTAKKAETIGRVAGLLVQGAIAPTPPTAWLQATQEAHAILTSLGHCLQIAQPGSEHKITINIRVSRQTVNRTPQAHEPSAWARGQSQLQPQGPDYHPPTDLSLPPSHERFSLGDTEPLPRNRIANYLLKTG